MKVMLPILVLLFGGSLSFFLMGTGDEDTKKTVEKVARRIFPFPV